MKEAMDKGKAFEVILNTCRADLDLWEAEKGKRFAKENVEWCFWSQEYNEHDPECSAEKCGISVACKIVSGWKLEKEDKKVEKEEVKEEVQEEVQEEKAEKKKPAKEAEKKAKTGRKVLKVGMEFRREYKGEAYEAEAVEMENGKVGVQYDGKVFPSLTAVALVITGYAKINGWDFWKTVE